MKHTPGPWEVHPDIGTPVGTLKVAPPGWRQALTIPLVTAVYGRSGEQEANARLIAAAPDLYAALVETLDELQQAREIIGHPWPTATSAVAHRAEDALRKVERD